MRKSFLHFLVFIMACSLPAYTQIITTVAGGGTSGLGDGGQATACELNNPYSTAVDGVGNLYIADQNNHRIRKVNTAGIVTTIAGTGFAGYSGDDSAATAAKLYKPTGVAVDGTGNVYISDNFNHRIRKVNTSGIITTVAGTGDFGYSGDNGPATLAQLYSPHGIAVDGSGNLYICDVLNNRLRKVNASGIITTIAGNGLDVLYSGDGIQATAADIGQPFGVAIDASGNVFFADLSNNRVCKINTSGIINTVAGTGIFGYSGDNGAATIAQIKQPFSVAIDEHQNLYIADYFNMRIRKVNSSGTISTYAGTETSGYSGDNGPATMAELGGPIGVTVDGAGNLYIADDNNMRIRQVKSTAFINNQDFISNNILIYPNPSHGDIAINISSNVNGKAHIEITDMTGKKVKDIVTTTNNCSNLKLDERSGLYFISVTTSQGTSYAKLVVAP